MKLIARSMRRLTALVLTLVVAVTLVVPASAASAFHSFALGQTTLTAAWEDHYLDGPTTTYKPELARFCLELIALDSPAADAETATSAEIRTALEAMGFTVEHQANYGKEETDQTHTTAYTVASRTAAANGREVKLYAVVISPNTIGELVGNFDFAAETAGNAGSRDYDTRSAKSFTKSAAQIRSTLDQLVGDGENVRFLITGESRGGGYCKLSGKALKRCLWV